MNQKGFSNIVIGIIVAVILIGAGGYFWLGQKPTVPPISPIPLPAVQQPKAEKEPTPESKTSQISLLQEVSTDNWLLYKDPTYGYTLRYPPDYDVIPAGEVNGVSYDTSFFADTNLGVSGGDFPTLSIGVHDGTGKSLLGWWNEQKYSDEMLQEGVAQIGIYDAIVFNCPGCWGPTYIFRIEGNLIVEAFYSTTREPFEQILSTFKYSE